MLRSGGQGGVRGRRLTFFLLFLSFLPKVVEKKGAKELEGGGYQRGRRKERVYDRKYSETQGMSGGWSVCGGICSARERVFHTESCAQISFDCLTFACLARRSPLGASRPPQPCAQHQVPPPTSLWRDCGRRDPLRAPDRLMQRRRARAPAAGVCVAGRGDGSPPSQRKAPEEQGVSLSLCLSLITQSINQALSTLYSAIASSAPTSTSTSNSWSHPTHESHIKNSVSRSFPPPPRPRRAPQTRAWPWPWPRARRA